MKNKAARQVRVGIFVAIGLALFMLIVFLLGDLGGLFRNYYTLRAKFEDISGLREGSPIFLAGLNIGEVEKIRFPDKLDEKKVLVTIKLQSRFKDRIREDSKASITTQGLLGDKAVFVTVGTPQFPELKDDGEIGVEDSFSINQFAEKGGQLLENVTELAANLNQTIKDIRQKDSFLHALVYDPDGKNIIKNVTSTLSSVDRIVGDLQHGSGVMHALIYDPVTKDFGKEISAMVKNLHAVTENFKKVSVKIEKGEGSIGALINDPTVYYDLMTLLGNANRNKILRTVIRATLATNEKDLTGSKK